MRRIDRREFAKEASLAFLTGVSVTVSACGGSDYSSSPTPTPTPPATSGDETGDISANHGHAAVIQAAWIQAGSPVTNLDIRGAATHSHMISLVANAMAAIKVGNAVQTESTSDSGHTHMVTFNSDNPNPPTRY